jgi:hypothetical protein
MAVNTWDGAAGTTDWNTAGNWNTTGETDRVPTDADDVIIPDTSSLNNPTLGAHVTINSLEIQTNGTIVGGGYKIIVDGENGSGFAVDNDGIISGNLDLEINTTTPTDIDLAGTSGNFEDLKLNDANCDVTMKADCILDGTLTIAAGQLSTGTGGYGFSNLTVAGNCSIAAGATLEGNASSGATVRLYSLTVNGTYSATGGETIITGETSGGRAVDIVGTFTHNSGTLSIQSPMDTLLRWPSSSTLHHLRINDASCIARPTGDNKPLIGGNLTVTAGAFNTLEDGQNHALTVTGTVTLAAGDLFLNASEATIGGFSVTGDGEMTGTTHANGLIVLGNWRSAGSRFNNADGKVVFKGTSGGTIAMNGAGSTGDGFYDLEINIAGQTYSVAEWDLTGIENNLTITAGTLDTNSTHNHTLTVEGATSITGTLTCNASAITLGDNVDDAWSVVLEAGGTFTGGSGTHRLGAVNITSSSNQWTWTSGNTYLSGRSSSGNQYKVFNNFTAGKVTAAGTVIVDQARTPTSIRCDDTTGINNLTMNSGTGRVLHLEDDLTTVGNINISAGTISTRNHQDNTDYDLTSGGYIHGAGTLAANSSDIRIAASNDIQTQMTGVAPDFAASTGGINKFGFNGDVAFTGAMTVTCGSVGGNWTNAGTSTVTISNHNNKTNNQTGSLYNLTINNAGNTTKCSSTQTILGALTITAGTFDMMNQALDVTGATSVTGILDAHTNGDPAITLGALTIASGGVYKATSGTTTLTGDFDNNGTDPTTSFVHNDGTVKMGAVGNAILRGGSSPTGTIFFNLLHDSGGYVDAYEYYKVITKLTVDASRRWFMNGSSHMKLGDTTRDINGEIEINGELNFSSANTGTGTANSITGDNTNAGGAALITINNGASSFTNGNPKATEFKNVNFVGTLTTPVNSWILKMMGDCEFDAVTVSAASTLNLNGQRAEFGGAFDLTTGALAMNDSMAVFKHTIDCNGRVITSNTGTTIIHNPPSTSEKLITSLYFGGTFFAQGAESEVNGYAWGGSSGEYPAKVFVGGQLDCQQSVKTTTTMQVATGGELRGNDRTLTCEGDFTTSGGLIGNTGIYNNGIYNAQFAASADQNPIYGSAHNFTVEGWFKFDSFGYDVLARSANTGSWMFLNNNTIFQFAFSSFDGTAVTLEAPTWTSMGIGTNEWVHIAGVCEGTSQKLYINGKLVSEATKGAGVGNGTGMVAIGSNPNSTAYVFDGHNHMLRMWREARTVTELRANMFTTTPTDSNTKLTMNVNYVAGGSGGTITDAAGNGNGVMYKTGHATTTDAAAWAGAGTITWTGGSTPSAGTLNMTGAGTTPTLTCPEATKFFNVTVGSSGEVILAGHPYIYGLLTVDSNGITDGSGSEIIGIAGTTTPVVHASKDFSDVSQIHYQTGGSAITITPTTYNLCRLTASTAGTLVGAFVGTTLQVDGGCSLTAQNTTIQTRGFNINGSNAAIDVRGTDVTLTTASPYGFTGGNSTTTLSAGPGTTITGNASKSTFASSNNFVVVGRVENLDVTGEELSVTGQVINCTGDIIQQHPTIDHDQQLDYDTADDRDIHLGRDMDKNTELINS